MYNGFLDGLTCGNATENKRISSEADSVNAKMNRAHGKILHLLETSQAEYRLHEHIPIRTIDEAQEKVPHLAKNLLKTVVFRIKDDGWILAAVSGSDRIHYKRLGECFGVNRRALRSVSPEEVQSDLGFEVGGVGPFPVAKDVQVVVDEKLKNLDRIFCGSGLNTKTVELRVADLIRLSRARKYPVTKK